MDPPPSRTAAARLASFALHTPWSAVPAEVGHRARLHLLDTIGCGIAALGLRAGGHATAIALGQGGKPESSLLGESTRVPAALAALANGTRCHALDFDDTHEVGICHSSTVVAPVAVAIGEAVGTGTDEVLSAYVLGSEVALRIAVATADGLYERGFHPTSVCGAFGAAAAASRLLRLDDDQAVNALGIVGSFASGLLEFLSDGSATKPVHAGWAAQAGIQAARLAAAGATGPASVIEGRFGLMASHASPVTGWEEICSDLGSTWEVVDLSIKPFPACHFAHSPTWAAGELADEHGLDHGDIAEVHVRVPAEGVALVLEPAVLKAQPRTPYDAKFSLPFMVAHRLVRGHVDLASFSPESIRDPGVLELAARVHSPGPLDPSPSRFAGEARLVTRGGKELMRLVADAPGSPRNPLDEHWVLSKFRSNAELALGSEEVSELMEASRLIDAPEAIDSMTSCLRACNVRTPTTT